MKKYLVLLLFVISSLIVKAQQYPAEWVAYTHSGYVFDIQSDTNDRNLSETDFKNYLLDIARTNLAKQIQIQVQDAASINKVSNDGHTSVSYASSTRFSTDVNLKLVETKSVYNPESKYGYAIAYINRYNASNYYKNELMLIYNKIINSIELSKMYIEEGFKVKAKSVLDSSLKQLALIDEPMLWMNIFGVQQGELKEWTDKFTTEEHTVKQMLAGLHYSTTVCVLCDAELCGERYPSFANEIKGALSTGEYTFSEDVESADFVIRVTSTTREGSVIPVGGSPAYFAYADAEISITKRATAQVVYENKLSAKGGDTRNFTEAARSAYKDLKKRIASAIKTTIKQ